MVLLRALQERRILQTERGKIAVGWLIVEDLVTVLALVLLPTWAMVRDQVGETGAFTAGQAREIGGAILLTFGKVVAFIAIMLVVGKRVVPWILHRVVHLGSRELFRLAVLAIALGVALGASELFGVSFALGAFFAGMIMGESELSHQAANETLPLRDAFAVLFFVSVGMLFDPMMLIRDPIAILGAVLIVVVGKSVAALAIMALFKQPKDASLLIAASLAQIGEFSFILAGLGVALNLLPPEARDFVLGAALLSILLNPVAFAVADRFSPKPLPQPQTAPLNPEPEPTAAPVLPDPTPAFKAVVVGYGRVGSLVGRGLAKAEVEYAVVEERQDLIQALADGGVTAVAGNAVSADMLRDAGIEKAGLLYVTVPDGFEAGRIVELARQINPALRIFARAHSEAEVEHLKNFGADVIISGEQEIAQAMIDATRL